MKLLNKILWKSKNKKQLLFAALGATMGLFLLLSAIQFYADMKKISGEKQGSDQFVLINKKVNFFNTLGAKSTFTDEEIDLIKSQDFVAEMATFTPNQYKVSASSSILGFYTELFFEALPDEFIDIETDNFEWQEGQNSLPIILSRDYLALYNFGFAPSQGLPQFTQSSIKKISIDINVGPKGAHRTFQGHIVGFSDRINSILVPLPFMEWANRQFGQSQNPGSSRMVLKTDSPYSQELATFLDKNAFEVSSGRLIGGRITVILKMLLILLALLGFLIVLLSILVFVLNFQLIISQSAQDIRLLLQIGYKPEQISSILKKLLFQIFAVVVGISLLAVFFTKKFFKTSIAEQGLQLPEGLHFVVFLSAGILAVVFIILNYRIINRNVLELYK